MSIGTVVNSETVTADDLTEPTIDDAADAGAGADTAVGAEAASALVRVTKGGPSSEELAALVAVVAAGASGADGEADGDTGARNSWGDPGEALDAMPRVFSPRSYRSGGFGGR